MYGEGHVYSTELHLYRITERRSTHTVSRDPPAAQNPLSSPPYMFFVQGAFDGTPGSPLLSYPHHFSPPPLALFLTGARRDAEEALDDSQGERAADAPGRHQGGECGAADGQAQERGQGHIKHNKNEDKGTCNKLRERGHARLKHTQQGGPRSSQYRQLRILLCTARQTATSYGSQHPGRKGGIGKASPEVCATTSVHASLFERTQPFGIHSRMLGACFFLECRRAERHTVTFGVWRHRMQSFSWHRQPQRQAGHCASAHVNNAMRSVRSLAWCLVLCCDVTRAAAC